MMFEKKTMKNAYKEVNEILDIMGDKYKNKIPENFRMFLYEQQNKMYKSRIKKGLKFNEQELLHETKVLLTYIYKKFWME